MSDRVKAAMENFKKGYNCAQATVLAFEDVAGLDRVKLLKLASSFGGGMGRLREVCGAFSGICMIAGLLYGYDSPCDDDAKEKHYRLIQNLAEQFKKENGSLICRELLSRPEGADTPVPEKRTENYYAVRPCEKIVGAAANILEKYIENQNQITEVNSMKIATACEGKEITHHFGHCENFMVFDTADGKIIGEQTIPNPGHKPGFLPNFLNERGVKVIISGGMGGGAVDIFNDLGIEVITGASGEARKAVEAYLKGNLKSDGAVCREHQHKDDCEK